MPILEKVCMSLYLGILQMTPTTATTTTAARRQLSHLAGALAHSAQGWNILFGNPSLRYWKIWIITILIQNNGKVIQGVWTIRNTDATPGTYYVDRREYSWQFTIIHRPSKNPQVLTWHWLGPSEDQFPSTRLLGEMCTLNIWARGLWTAAENQFLESS